MIKFICALKCNACPAALESMGCTVGGNLNLWGQTYKIHLTAFNLATINSYKIVMKLSTFSTPQAKDAAKAWTNE